jgi:tetratricopeptide (TPR) repeat protein
VRAVAVALALALAGCATGGWLGSGSPAWSGWQDAVDGRGDRGEALFARTAAADPGDAVARFGQATLAFERGDTAAAMDGHLGLLELAASNERARALGGAAAARVTVLMDEVADRRPFEARLLALSRAGLPWLAQLEVADLTGDIARRRLDAELLASEARRAGCITDARLAGVLGRLPRLDLDAPEAALRPDDRPLTVSGCRLLVPAVEGHPGVRLVRASMELPAGSYDVVLAFAGGALVRVDGGPWHRHGIGSVYGPRASAMRVKLGRGRHAVELRLGTFGGAVDLELGAFPAVETPSLSAGKLGEDVAALAATLSADAAGDLEGALTGVERLAGLRRFAVGLAAAGRVILRDATRPTSFDRDGARSLFRRAVGVDERLARVWRDLAAVELSEERPREASEAAEQALKAAPRFWAGELALMEASRTRGLERDVDRSLDRALAAVGNTPAGAAGCSVLELGMRRAQDRRRIDDERRLAGLLQACDPHATSLLESLRSRGDLAGVERLLRARLPTSADPFWLRGELAQVLLARGQARAAAESLQALVAAVPRDPQLRIRLADARVAAGDRAAAVAGLTEALRLFPTRAEVRTAARALGIPLPLDRYRLDGAAVIRAFRQAGRRYDAPAVLVLDRLVGRVFPDGSQMLLTHSIVRVQSKDGIERWGEVQIPEGAEVLTLRTHKPDGTIREPEEIFGKPTVSAPDLAPGDFVEWETLEVREPVDAFAPGFLGERFYFQSTEAPLDRSEYLLVTPSGLRLAADRRAGAPAPVEEPGPEGTKVVRFAVQRSPQVFPERATVAGLEWIPSVRVSANVSLEAWARFITDQLSGIDRTSPALRRAAQQIAASVKDRGALPAAVVKWVNEHVEPEADLLEPATFSLARGRGNRTALLLALGHTLGLTADVAFARPLNTAAADAPLVPQELDDFGDVVVRFATPAGTRFIDPRLRRAPFGYVGPALNGAPLLLLGEGRVSPERARSSTADARSVALAARLGLEGEGSATVTEELTGWPALEWVEMLDRAGNDRSKLRQDFEQHWLSQNFPGAVLTDLQVELRENGAAGARVAYTFSHPELATRDGSVLKIAPTFFRSQPARRYATEPARRTTLLLGADVPLDLEARIELPPGTKVIDPGDSGEVITAGGALRFAEHREVKGGQIILRRQARLPITRVEPRDYAEVAAKLRRVDPIEADEIRIQLPAK